MLNSAANIIPAICGLTDTNGHSTEFSAAVLVMLTAVIAEIALTKSLGVVTPGLFASVILLEALFVLAAQAFSPNRISWRLAVIATALPPIVAAIVTV